MRTKAKLTKTYNSFPTHRMSKIDQARALNRRVPGMLHCIASNELRWANRLIMKLPGAAEEDDAALSQAKPDRSGPRSIKRRELECKSPVEDRQCSESRRPRRHGNEMPGLSGVARKRRVDPRIVRILRGRGQALGEPYASATGGHDNGSRRPSEQEYSCRTPNKSAHGRKPSRLDHEENRGQIDSGIGPIGLRHLLDRARLRDLARRGVCVGRRDECQGLHRSRLRLRLRQQMHKGKLGWLGYRRGLEAYH